MKNRFSVEACARIVFRCFLSPLNSVSKGGSVRVRDQSERTWGPILVSVTVSPESGMK